MKSAQTGLLIFLLCFLPALLAASPHPRLLLTADDWEKLPERMESEPVVRNIIQAVIARADSALSEPLLTHSLTGRRMLTVSRDAIQRVLDLSTAWKATGKQIYFERCRDELLNLSDFKDWHPAHHLDTAEMQTAVAIGYDWLYADLALSERKTIASALLEKGLKTTLSVPDMLRKQNNWNQVCNGGVVLSALALQDIEPELSTKAIAAAIKGIPIGLKEGYSPDGAYAEGGTYWGYGSIYSILTVEALRKAGGPDPGIVSHLGFLESGRYITQIFGPTGLMFGYGDSREVMFPPSAAAAWMARETSNDALGALCNEAFMDLGARTPDRFLALAAFWLPPAPEQDSTPADLHFVASGKSPIAIHRTGMDPDDLYLGIKAGKAGVNHGHMDAGSFVLDMLGERWATDLGLQKYHSLEKTGISLFNRAQNSQRWTVYRLNNFSHNTLTYNGGLHRVKSEAKILDSVGPPDNRTEVDLTAPLGLPKGAKAIRTFQINGENRTATITDMISGLRPGDTITWNMMTRATAAPKSGGFALESNGKRILLDLASDPPETPVSTSADPPPLPHDETNPGITKISLEAKADTSGHMKIRATFRPSEP